MPLLNAALEFARLRRHARNLLLADLAYAISSKVLPVSSLDEQPVPKGGGGGTRAGGPGRRGHGAGRAPGTPFPNS